MKWRFCIAFTVAVALLVAPAIPASAASGKLYIATLREQGSSEAEAMGGSLYEVDPATAATKLVAPLRIGGVVPIGLTGLAVHPKTGIVYGITAGLARNIPRSLVSVDLATGNSTLVGSLGLAGSDIRFDARGTLYVWLTDDATLGVVDLGTGSASPIGKRAYADPLGGAIAIDEKGEVFVSATTAGGTLDLVDPATGRVTAGAHLSGAPYLSSLNSMAFGPADTLYAVNSNLGAPAKTNLVQIDSVTGKVTDIGALPNDTDPIAYVPAVSGSAPTTGNSHVIALALAFLAGIVVGWLLRRGRPKRAATSGP